MFKVKFAGLFPKLLCFSFADEIEPQHYETRIERLTRKLKEVPLMPIGKYLWMSFCFCVNNFKEI